MDLPALKEQTITELHKEYKILEEVFLKSIEENKSYDEVYPLFTQLRQVHAKIDEVRASNN